MEHRTNDLAYWINEREQMRHRKEAGRTGFKFGYSDDPAMGTVRYCNVRREDDKVTRWIAENWRNPNAEDPNLTYAMVAARMINWPETLAAIHAPVGGPTVDFELWAAKAKNYIRTAQERGVKTWTSAYTISTCGRQMKKEDYVFDHVLRQVGKEPWDTHWWQNGMNLNTAHKYLMTIDGLGSFLAAQVVADLKNTPGHPLENAEDWWTWSAHGPGSLRGLAAYYGTPVTPSTYASRIRVAYQEVMPLVDFSVGSRLHMQDFQNCLCEFSKFMRFREGGNVRNRYPAG